ncbi:DOPA 4,5-dioxygenase [Neolecta irregularis DAH-3]|uniref:DOPA 4,5-dioxygenase n=1 Tax=Neolecta irregularis (strain DAH-3) TaxID=1198029 RepID=A0A1U7LTE5_NEOID|nr:DOPA 4,5-dioxygenase [Neolecta irregularis DAH-3]|eukprot:OLL25937.1 DOPA 4,5-dioxygenase [Neolecta irregularis DAH-3]
MELNRGDLSVLIHPLTRYEILDHTVRASWLGPSIALDPSELRQDIGQTPLQYPELKMGYSKNPPSFLNISSFV